VVEVDRQLLADGGLSVPGACPPAWTRCCPTDALSRALALLPPRQRAVLVLRYWEQLSEAEAAELLGCSVGTVKSTASRGLSRLRELTATWDISQTVTSNRTGR